MKKLYALFLVILITYPLLAQPAGYYNGAEGKNGDELKTALHNIIKGHIDFSYSSAKYLINYSDADPLNESNVILFYTQRSQDADTYGTGVDDINREHVWAKSHGGFEDERPMDGDAFNLRPADASVNNTRGNLDFDFAPGGSTIAEAPGTIYTANRWEPADAVKGQVARIIFYMATRYEGTDGELDLEAVDDINTSPNPQHGKLSTLLQWNRDFPPSEFERRRNERIYESQKNRNPFIDNPAFADLIWNSDPIPEITIGEMAMIPEYPLVNETAEISVAVDATLTLTDVRLYWGDSFDSEVNDVTMGSTGNVYTGSINLTGFTENEYVYYKIRATDGTNEAVVHGSYRIPKDIASESLTSIPDIQGTGSSSPLLSQTITTSGYVIANFDNTLYIQSARSPYNGMGIYGSNHRAFRGDSIILTAVVDEYNELTELKDIAYIYSYPTGKTIEPIDLTVSQVSEDYEGMLIRIRNAQFASGGVTIPFDQKSYTFSDATGSMVIYSRYDSRLAGNQLPSGNVDITGILSQYQGTYQLLVRDMNDFQQASSAKTIIAGNNPFEIYPNPNHGQFSVRIILQAPQPVGLKIYNITGKMIFDRNFDGTKGLNTLRFDDTKLPAGIYFVRIVADNRAFMQKMVVE